MDYQLLLDDKEKSIFTNLNNKSLKPTNKDLVKIYNYYFPMFNKYLRSITHTSKSLFYSCRISDIHSLAPL